MRHISTGNEIFFLENLQAIRLIDDCITFHYIHNSNKVFFETLEAAKNAFEHIRNYVVQL